MRRAGSSHKERLENCAKIQEKHRSYDTTDGESLFLVSHAGDERNNGGPGQGSFAQLFSPITEHTGNRDESSILSAGQALRIVAEAAMKSQRPTGIRSCPISSC